MVLLHLFVKWSSRSTGQKNAILYPRSPQRMNRARLRVKAGEESGVAWVAADRVEDRVHAEKRHGVAVLVERAVEGDKGLVETVGAEVVQGKLILSAGLRRSREQG